LCSDKRAVASVPRYVYVNRRAFEVCAATAVLAGPPLAAEPAYRPLMAATAID